MLLDGMGMSRGTVTQFDTENGCGFIKDDDGTDVFFYDVEITPGTVLKEGDVVTYGIAMEYQGPIAVGIRQAPAKEGEA